MARDTKSTTLEGMNKPRLAVLVLALLLFTGYTATVVVQHGPLGFLDDHAVGGWHLQIFIDLVLSATAFLMLAVPDARRRGLSPWPYVVMTVALGSIGIFTYLVRREFAPKPAPLT